MLYLPFILVVESTTSRDGGQDTQGVGQSSYEVTFVRPDGARPQGWADRSETRHEAGITLSQTQP
jgi:hypothetical protein